ncbi:MAG: peptidylprolyl isomerase [Pseudomonadota bacterium]
MILRLSVVALAANLLFSSAAFAQAAAPAPETVVAKINGKAITEADVAAAKTELAAALEGLPEEARRAQLIDYLITLNLLSEEARKQKMDSSADYEKRLHFVTDKLLMEQLLKQEIDKTITPDAIKAFYNERLKTIKPEEEVHARHILVPTEEEAKAAIAELNKGKDFAELAKTLSKDPGSGKQGGDLGYFTKERMVPEFSEAAFKGAKGKVIPQPVKSQFGWHVIKVEDKRVQPAPALAEVEPQIRAFLMRKAQADLALKVRKDAKIEKTEAKVNDPLEKSLKN